MPAKKVKKETSNITGKPKFPYCTKPNALRRFLDFIPKKPKPTKVNGDTLKAWGLKNTNDQTIIRVLKALDLITSANEPTDKYVAFMSPDKGPSVLGLAIKDVWAPLFENSHEPHREDDATLKNLFHVHSGGGESAIAYQIQTFKAACDHADFTATGSAGMAASNISVGQRSTGANSAPAGAAIHIDLHIHLPENKSRRDYEYMFEDIARHIFGRNDGEDRTDE